MAREYKPAAITLDILLPDCSGFSVLERLKRDPQTSHIPVHVVSIAEERKRTVALGAASFTQKTSGRQQLATIVNRIRQSRQDLTRNVLIVDSDESNRHSIIDLIGNGIVHTFAVANIAEAVGAFAMQTFDFVVSAPELSDGSVADLIERTQVLVRDATMRLVVHSPQPMSAEIAGRLAAVHEKVVVRTTCSLSELVELACIYLHRNESQLSPEKQKMLAEVRERDPRLAGKKVLMVDDDARNIFAITSALERANIEVIYAENGKVALDRLRDIPDIELVLMDIMMPEMDGYEAMRAIRNIERFESLPIIAVTAKAMLGDREKCVQAGASDYIAKPVDLEQLFSLLRVWLPDRPATAAAASMD